MKSTKEALRQLKLAFEQVDSGTLGEWALSESASTSDGALDQVVAALVDEQLSAFASRVDAAAEASAATGAGNSAGAGSAAASTSAGAAGQPPAGSVEATHHAQAAVDKERARWRDALSDTLAAFFPAPPAPPPALQPSADADGEHDDGEAAAARRRQVQLVKLSTFVRTIERLSSALKDDFAAALVTRRDVATTWWPRLLAPLLLGHDSDKYHHARQQHRAGQPGRIIIVSRDAREAALRITAWAMLDRDQDHGNHRVVGSFAANIFRLLDDRSGVRPLVHDVYGRRNLEEIVLIWAESAPQDMFNELAARLQDSTSPVKEEQLLPSVALALRFLSTNSSKAYHALKTSFVPALMSTCLCARERAVAHIATKCLVIFLVSLPVIIGEHAILGAVITYARLVSWESASSAAATALQSPPPVPLDGEVAEDEEEDIAGDEDDALALFTVLYGVYPCTLALFLRDPRDFITRRPWRPPSFLSLDDGALEVDIDVLAVRERAARHMRRHVLVPALLLPSSSSSTASTTMTTASPSSTTTTTVAASVDTLGAASASELVDTARWADFEPADVMAACDRNLVSTAYVAAERSNAFHHFITQPQHVSAPAPPPPTTGAALVASTSATQEQPVDEDQQETGRSRTASASADDQPRGRRGRPEAVRTDSETAPGAVPLSFYSKVGKLASAPRSASLVRTNTASREGSPLSKTQQRIRQASRAREESNATDSPPVSQPTSPQLRPAVSLSMRASGNNVLVAELDKLRTENFLLQSEVNYHLYLKQLHLAHMGTLHRETVLESGEEVERQNLHRTIRSLRLQLEQSRQALERTRAEATLTKSNWTSHIDDLRERLRAMREKRQSHDVELKALQAKLAEVHDLAAQRARRLDEQGAVQLELQNQASIDAHKLARITEYEDRIETLVRTLALCDEDLCRLRDIRRESDALVARWHEAETLLATVSNENDVLKGELRRKDDMLVAAAASATVATGATATPTWASPDSTPAQVLQMKAEIKRLRLALSEAQAARV